MEGEKIGMKTKPLLILVGILVILGLLVLLLENPFGKGEYEKKVEAAGPLFSNFRKENVTKIELTASGTTTTLTKEGDRWLVASMNNFPTDGKAVEELLDKVAGFKTTQLVSNNPDKQATLQVEDSRNGVDSSGVEAKLLGTNDSVLAHLFVGKTTPDFFSSYIRAADSNNVYVAEGYLKSIFDKGSRTWKDRTIFAFNKGDVTHLTIKSEAEVIELQLDAEGNWQMLKPVVSAAKKTDVESLLETLSTLKADDFAEGSDLAAYGLDAPKSSISAALNDGSTKALLIGKEEEGKHYVKNKDKDIIFTLYKSRINQLIKKSDDLKDNAPVTDAHDESSSKPGNQGKGE